MRKVKSNAGRKMKSFGTRLDVDKAFSVTASEDKVIKALSRKLDLPEARLFRQIVFGITAPINLNEEN